MTTTMAWLPRALNWLFWIFMVLSAIAVAAILIALLVDPKLPANTTLGTAKVEFLGLPGTIYLENSMLGAEFVHGGLSVRVSDAAGLFEVVKHAGLPVALLKCAYFVLLFDLMRRLFRNVARGESFTRPSLRLVQGIGGSLLVFSLVFAVATGWFYSVLLDYLSQHAALSVSGMVVRMPQGGNYDFGDGGGFPFGTPFFFSGLLVLAMSEVFRQGLSLKSDSDLTI